MHGVLLPRHRAVHVTPTVAKASAGAVEHVPMALVGGLPATLSRLRDAGIWVVGLDDAADRTLFDLGDLAAEGICLVLGAEGAGCRGWPGSGATWSSASRCAAASARSTCRPPPRWRPTRSPATVCEPPPPDHGNEVRRPGCGPPSDVPPRRPGGPSAALRAAFGAADGSDWRSPGKFSWAPDTTLTRHDSREIDHRGRAVGDTDRRFQGLLRPLRVTEPRAVVQVGDESTLTCCAGLAQLAEHLTCNHEVVGSIPTPGSNKSPAR